MEKESMEKERSKKVKSSSKMELYKYFQERTTKMNIQQQNNTRQNDKMITLLRGLFTFAVMFSFLFGADSSNYAYASKINGQTAENGRNSNSAELREEFYPLNFPGSGTDDDTDDGIYIADETEASIVKLEEKRGIKVPNLLKDIYAKRVDIEKFGYIGEAEGMILVSVFPCLSKSDKPDMGYMSIKRLYEYQRDYLKELIPDNYLPFATDGFGNDFYLDMNKAPDDTTIIYGDQTVFFDESDPIRFTEFKSAYGSINDIV
ncbi:MAG: SMI1/KNR4 family protein [Candidatus Ancillula sp.]|jgi:hypothetical protein|nr:SMI1/KNR4 family protein [Candidatus Ancillula sp.]